MRQRAKKRVEKKKRLATRATQREKVAVLKLNFVSGLLNRFYFAFLEEFKMDRGGTVKHALRSVAMSLQERQMASAIVSGGGSAFITSANRPLARLTEGKAKRGETKGVADKEQEEPDPDFLLQLQCNLRGRDRRPLSLSQLMALPMPLKEYKRSVTRLPGAEPASKRATSGNGDLSDIQSFDSDSSMDDGVSIAIEAPKAKKPLTRARR